jgi:hypothetical protein
MPIMLTQDNKLTKTLTKPLTKTITLLIILTLTITLAGSAQATTESLNIQAGKESVRTIDLGSKDKIRITFTVVTHTSGAFHFWMVFPNSTKRDYGETTQATISFNPEVKGACELHFDNSNSSENQLVTLNYEIEHFIFGISQIPFLLIVVTFFLLCIIAGYIILGKYS